MNKVDGNTQAREKKATLQWDRDDSKADLTGHCAFLTGMACLMKKIYAVDQLSASSACHEVGPFALLPTYLPCVLLLGGSVRLSQEYETIHSNLVNCYDDTFLGQ